MTTELLLFSNVREVLSSRLSMLNDLSLRCKMDALEMDDNRLVHCSRLRRVTENRIVRLLIKTI